ncbi:MAG: FmdE family protein [Xanthobacteraceae bacterium]
MTRVMLAALVLVMLHAPAWAETPEEWIALGVRIHGGFGAFIPLGIKIGADSLERLNLKPREVAVLYHDTSDAPCACIADGIAIATQASVGQRSLVIAADPAPSNLLGLAVIRPKQGGSGIKYRIPIEVLRKLAEMNRTLDPRGRYDAVMKDDGLFSVETLPGTR